MIIVPARRFFWFAIAPSVLVVAGRGAPAAIVVAWILMGSLVVAATLDGVFARLRIRVNLYRETPSRLFVDQPNTVSWIVENSNDFAVALELADRFPASARAEPDVLAIVAPPRSRGKFTYTLIPVERGPTVFGDLNYRIRGFLGLVWIQKRLAAPLELRVLPHLANAKAADLAERRALMRQSGSRRYRWRGAGTSFESLREYDTHDDIRWIDWKATARLNRPISRNFEVERHQQVVLLVDASRALTTYCGERTKFDAILEAAILLARSALDQGDGLGLIVFSDQIDVYLHPRRERAQLKAVIENLYAKQPRLVEPNYEAALTLASKRNSRRTLFILLTDVTVIESARRMQLYLRILTPRHLPMVVTIADETIEQTELSEPRTARDFYRTGVATELMFERTLLLEELRRSGVEILDTRADRVASSAIDRYLELKRRLRI